jgi:hypothetical protein
MGEKAILSRGFAPSKRCITSIKSLEEGVFRGLEGGFGHVILEADVVFVYFSWAGFGGGGGPNNQFFLPANRVPAKPDKIIPLPAI